MYQSMLFDLVALLGCHHRRLALDVVRLGGVFFRVLVVCHERLHLCRQKQTENKRTKTTTSNNGNFNVNVNNKNDDVNGITIIATRTISTYNGNER